MYTKTIASEYVSAGHPDKISDQIADALLDEYLRRDPNSRTGIEVMVKDNIVVLGGEVNSAEIIDYETAVRNVFDYLKFPENHRLRYEDIKIINLIGQQSPEISQGVDRSQTIIGAGDQGFAVGYATYETDTFLPLGYYLAKLICNYVASLDGFGPDTKAQVIVDYTYNDEGDLLSTIVRSILVSTMHTKTLNITTKTVKDSILYNLDFFLPQDIWETHIVGNKFLKINVNPCGAWRIGGPVSDCGVTGRKIVVDQYGGYENVGGGAFSGKDGTKVDRSAAYMARYIAKNRLASGICNTAKVELSYMIGVPEPSSINIEMDKNQKLTEQVKRWVYDNINMTPYGIMSRFNLWYPKYLNTARFGHFGDPSYEWEKTDLANKIKEDFNVPFRGYNFD
jgi:S-adenosylmethionine synthetase